jgi:hypothetical protein
LIGLFFGFLNSFDDKQLPCPSYCGVDHAHVKTLKNELHQEVSCDTLYYYHDNDLPHISQRQPLKFYMEHDNFPEFALSTRKKIMDGIESTNHKP